MAKYCVVDIETANPDITSICQIAIVCYENGTIIEQWESLINPKSYFHPINVSIHGIDERDVRNAPTISDVEPIIKSMFAENIVCSYGAFDRSSLQRIFPELKNDWLDIVRVVRRSWDQQFAKHGYGLANIAEVLKIEQKNHHNALDDVLVAGEILIRALNDSQEDLDFWLTRVKKTIDLDSYKQANRKQEGNPDGALYGETIVFTGELSIPRSQAKEMALKAGCNVATGVSKKVTMLVLGDQDPVKLRNKTLSTKEEKALELINKGHRIQLLTETDFVKLLNYEYEIKPKLPKVAREKESPQEPSVHGINIVLDLNEILLK